jgi:hypothetical protein
LTEIRYFFMYVVFANDQALGLFSPKQTFLRCRKLVWLIVNKWRILSLCNCKFDELFSCQCFLEERFSYSIAFISFFLQNANVTFDFLNHIKVDVMLAFLSAELYIFTFVSIFTR